MTTRFPLDSIALDLLCLDWSSVGGVYHRVNTSHELMHKSHAKTDRGLLPLDPAWCSMLDC